MTALQTRESLKKKLNIHVNSTYCADCNRSTCDGCELYIPVDDALCDVPDACRMLVRLHGRAACQACFEKICKFCDDPSVH